jgi:phage baseplate assembly protein V
MLAPLSRRLRLLVSRAVVTAIHDDGKIQTAQVKLLAGEVRDGVEVLHQYGLTSNPLGQIESLYFSVGADRDHGVMVCVADRQHRRKNLAPGEVALYTDEDTGSDEHHLHCRRGKIIEIVAGASKATLGPDGITLSIGASSIALTAGGITITTPSLNIVKG